MNTNSFIDKAIHGLKRVAVEIEEFQLQFSLGKAEAKDTYENVKKELYTYLHEAKIHLDSTLDRTSENQLQWKLAFETLQLQLALGKAETVEIYEEQRKEIEIALSRLETLIRKNEAIDAFYINLHSEIEKFKIKLDILKLQYRLNTMDAKIEFEKKKEDFSKNLSELMGSLRMQAGKAENKWDEFKNEISDAYSSLRKVFVK